MMRSLQMQTAEDGGLPELDVLTPQPLPSSDVENTLVGTAPPILGCGRHLGGYLESVSDGLASCRGWQHGSELLFFKEMLVRFR